MTHQPIAMSFAKQSCNYKGGGKILAKLYCKGHRLSWHSMTSKAGNKHQITHELEACNEIMGQMGGMSKSSLLC